MTAPALERTAVRDPLSLLPASEFSAVVSTVVGNNPGMDRAVAERVTAEALKFVATAARSHGQKLVPSRLVDEGWHALILHTRVYRELGVRVGVFVDHVPTAPGAPRHGDGRRTATVEAIRSAGFEPDLDLWEGAAANCCEHEDCPGDCGAVIVPIPDEDRLSVSSRERD
ncbi:glycine-rich domain-containing protein [Streptomyces sp. NPDC008079]|uniref:glycine-rich domain-containing protein n=1 Tax=Streptomyces sp. NPDC008079 TaxID=3364806 RepID=UPI0036E4A227